MTARADAPLTVLITGAGSGLGLEIAVRLAASGCKVAAGLRDAGQPHALREAASAAGAGDRLHIVQMDVTDDRQVCDAVREAESLMGGIDVLINNAGFAAGGFTEELDSEAWRKQFDVNLFGAIATVRAALPGMRKRRRGLIVQMSSISGRAGFPGFAAYASSKFALEGWSESLRHELRPHGIDVLLIEPGAYRTAIWAKGFAALPDKPAAAYAGQLRQVLAYARQSAEQAPPPARAADQVVRIVMRRGGRRLRYPLGAGVKLTLLARRWLPWRLYERIVSRILARIE